MNILGKKALEGGKEAFILEGTVIKREKSVEPGFEPCNGGYPQSNYSSELINLGECQKKIDAAFHVEFWKLMLLGYLKWKS